jgi:transcriptional regulator
MAKESAASRRRQSEMVQGTLDMLVLRTLRLGPAHGYTIAESIQRRSEDQLLVGQGSLYPSLHRLEDRGLIDSYWAVTENNRRARYYRITAKGRRQLAAETRRWEGLVRAVSRVLDPTGETP